MANPTKKLATRVTASTILVFLSSLLVTPSVAQEIRTEQQVPVIFENPKGTFGTNFGQHFLTKLKPTGNFAKIFENSKSLIMVLSNSGTKLHQIRIPTQKFIRQEKTVVLSYTRDVTKCVRNSRGSSLIIKVMDESNYVRFVKFSEPNGCTIKTASLGFFSTTTSPYPW